MRPARSYWAAFLEMPVFLKFIFCVCLAGIGFVLGPTVPFLRFGLNGEVVTQAKLWTSGAGPAMMVLGMILLLTAHGIAHRMEWARLLFLFVMPIQTIIGLVVGLYDQTESERMMVEYVMLFAPLFWWYLFRKESVRNYFRQDMG